MTLPYDIARCRGRNDPDRYGQDLLAPCLDCLRRTSPGNPHGQWHQAPPEFVDGQCPSRIGETA